MASRRTLVSPAPALINGVLYGLAPVNRQRAKARHGVHKHYDFISLGHGSNAVNPSSDPEYGSRATPISTTAEIDSNMSMERGFTSHGISLV
jgi:hypothetical protein